MRIIRWSIDNPAPVAAFYVAVLALAVIAVLRIVPLRMMPYVQSPLLAVVTRPDRMPVEDVERTVTTPIEESLVGLDGVRFIGSTSMRGMSIVTLEFSYQWDLGRAAQDVAGRLPVLALDPTRGDGPRLQTVDPLNIPVLRLALRAPTRDMSQLRQIADTVIIPRLRGLTGVESVYAVGGQVAKTEILLDLDRLSLHGLSLSDVRQAIESAEIANGGTVSSEGKDADLRVQRASADPLDILLRPGLRLGDVARLAGLSDSGQGTDAHGSHGGGSHEGAIYRLNGQEAVEINVLQRSTGSSPTTVAAVREEMARIIAERPDLVVEEAYDNAHFVEIMARNLLADLALAVLLSGLVVLLFLGELRSTMIVLITIPTSLAFAILFFVPLGLSLNSSSLVGLLLAIGRLVDDAIVDLHAVHRHRAQGKSARQAALDGCSEVRRAVIGATITLGLALLPLTFCGGITQDMFASIVWPLILSLAASLLVALTLTPLLASRLLTQPQGPQPALPRLLSKAYRRLLNWALGHRALVLYGAACVTYVAFMMFPLIGSEMMPLADTGQAYAVLQARPGTSLEDTARLAGALEQILLHRKEVVKVSTEVGWAPAPNGITGYGGLDANTASMMITLTDKDQRSASIWEILDQVWREGTQTIPGLQRLTLKEMGADLMANSMAPVEVLIHGPQLGPTPAPEVLQQLQWLAERTRLLAVSNPSLVQVGLATSLDRPQWNLQVDAARATELGLSVASVAEQTVWALDDGSLEVGDIALRWKAQSSTDLGQVSIVGADERLAPLHTLASLEKVAGPDMIMHDNLRRATSVSASYRPGGPGSMLLTMDLMMQSQMSLPYPPGYGMEMRGDMTQMMDSFGRLLAGLGLALGLIYLSLMVVFRSVTLPLALMASIPLELAGVFAALLVFGQTFSTVSLLGIVVLSGMDVTASILLLDGILGNRQRGLSCQEAVLEAGTVRLSPILMTVLVTLAAMAPLAFAARTGFDAYAPLATVVMGGLAVSTPLTLLVVPVLVCGLLEKSQRRTKSRSSAIEG